MSNQFEIAGGTIAGRDHVLAGRNNQDAYHWTDHDGLLIAAVADGCGSGKSSEVGARIGVRLMVEALRECLVPDDPETTLERVSFSILMHLNHLAHAMGASLSQTVEDYFLFTVVGTVIAPWGAWIFSRGDGVIAANGEEKILGPFPNNAPPYLGYGIRFMDRDHEGTPLPRFILNAQIPLLGVQSVLVGTDGALDIAHAVARRWPGKDELAGPLSQFWEDDRYFKNPDAIRRRLTLMNRDATRIDWTTRTVEKEPGLLPDDTTVVVIRRKK